ncbi:MULTISPECIES: hypothetical protein [Streptomyces rochei group]|uniref:hypothetical protein n=1 Tax=Streptomyces rochei group TaxID=2867164 RepID=UPI0018745B43|nr:hypothetical protein [Streptomyces vinaceusdrappus]GHC37582.1 hypothetical protein GCM10010308_65270 [Streptomyces vinaceusdrappus]
MPTATLTADDLILKHAANIAYVAEMETPATDLADFVQHLTYAARNFSLARINGHEDLETAATLLAEATEMEGTQETLLRRAAVLLRIVSEMTDEYRDMVGD